VTTNKNIENTSGTLEKKKYLRQMKKIRSKKDYEYN